MRATFAIAALAGSALAAPSYGRPQGNQQNKNVHVVVETVVHTVYVTEGYEIAKPTPSPEPVYEAPAEPTTTVVYEEPKPTSKYEAPVEPTPVPEAPKPTPTPEPQPEPETPAPSNGGYMGIVDEYRQKMGLKALKHSAKLESNAADCARSGNGNMVHKLNEGSMAQVLAPAEDTLEGFKKAFVGGWLCELPNTPGLGDECATMSEGWSYQGQTGHAEILTSDAYSEIGCATVGGICSCDLA